MLLMRLRLDKETRWHLFILGNVLPTAMLSTRAFFVLFITPYSAINKRKAVVGLNWAWDGGNNFVHLIGGIDTISDAVPVHGISFYPNAAGTSNFLAGSTATIYGIGQRG